ncbi:hypothetical protein, partial [Chlorogloea sp. CCALA 695]|uniref:hypothetical protein n=1 Tax=Chlorogloea sp. CCALA 695 TaxID=2107693 RepID=UPI000D064C8B
MEPTIEELKASLEKLRLEPDPPPRPSPRETAPEIKTPLAMSVRDAAMHVIEKRNNATEWQKGQMADGEVYDDSNGGVSERINGLEISVCQRQDSSVSVEIYDDAYSDATMHQNIPDRHYEFTLLDTNSHGEAVYFLPEHSIYERMGVTKDEFAHLVTERLSGMANKIDLQSSIQQESTLATSSVQVANERLEANLLPQDPLPVTVEKEQIGSVPANSVTWMESLKAQLGNVDGSKLQVFAGNNKVYEQTDNVVTTDKLATPVGEKVQQALENPNELKGSVRVVVDGEKVYHAKNGQVLENKHSLTLENSPVTHQKSLNVVPEGARVSELQTQNLPVTPEKSLNVVPEVAQVSELQAQNLPVTPEKTLEPALKVTQVAQVQEQVFQGDRAEIIDAVVLDVSPVIENQKSNSGAIVLARQDKEMIPFPINPTPIELDAKMPEVVNPNNASTRGSVEQALADALARIDSLQAQLKDTQKSLEDLSKFVRNDNLKSWAEHKVTDVNKTSQSIAEQAKSKVMQWVQAKTVQVKEAVQGKVNEVKTFAQDKVNEVKTAAQIKVNEVKTVAQDKVNEVKTAAQDKVSEVKIATQDKVNEV